jgi:DNA polymerase-3 subunit delta
MSAPPVHLVQGDDPTLRGDAVRALIAELLGSDDASLALEEFTLAAKGGGEGDGTEETDSGAVLASALLSATTPPFGTDRRVIVIREVGALVTADVAALARYLEDPMPTTALVLVAGGGRLAPALTKAVKAAGGAEIKTTEATPDALARAAKAAGVALSPAAQRRAAERIGEDTGRVAGLVDLLASTYGGATVDVDALEPFLGAAGSVPAYKLTGALDDGDLAGALDVLNRLRDSGFHPLQVMVMLHRHYQRLLRLDDPGVTDEASAVAALGGKVKPYPAKLALRQTRALGTEGIRAAYDALARADVDLRGGSGAPEDAVLEILIARLATLSRRAGAARGRR